MLSSSTRIEKFAHGLRIKNRFSPPFHRAFAHGKVLLWLEIREKSLHNIYYIHSRLLVYIASYMRIHEKSSQLDCMSPRPSEAACSATWTSSSRSPVAPSISQNWPFFAMSSRGVPNPINPLLAFTHFYVKRVEEVQIHTPEPPHPLKPAPGRRNPPQPLLTDDI